MNRDDENPEGDGCDEEEKTAAAGLHDDMFEQFDKGGDDDPGDNG